MPYWRALVDITSRPQARTLAPAPYRSRAPRIASLVPPPATPPTTSRPSSCEAELPLPSSVITIQCEPSPIRCASFSTTAAPSASAGEPPSNVHHTSPRPPLPAWASTALQRSSLSSIPRPTLTSRCTRFLVVLDSGTFWKKTRGPVPPGSRMPAASSQRSSGIPFATAQCGPRLKPRGRRILLVPERERPEPGQRPGTGGIHGDLSPIRFIRQPPPWTQVPSLVGS